MEEVVEILYRVGAIIENDHFVGTFGLHFDTYINKDFLYVHTEDAKRIGELFAEKYKDKNIEVVVGPAMGGIILSQWTAYALSKMTGREVLGVYTEKSPISGQVFTRGYDKYVKNKRVLVVEDIVTTGGSVAKTVDVIKEAGGEIVATCAMVNRNENLGQEALASIFVATYKSEDCPLCKSGVPINTTVGHGKKFLESQSN